MWLMFIIQSVLTWEFKEYYNCGSWLGDSPFNNLVIKHQVVKANHCPGLGSRAYRIPRCRVTEIQRALSPALSTHQPLAATWVLCCVTRCIIVCARYCLSLLKPEDSCIWLNFLFQLRHRKPSPVFLSSVYLLQISYVLLPLDSPILLDFQYQEFKILIAMLSQGIFTNKLLER